MSKPSGKDILDAGKAANTSIEQLAMVAMKAYPVEGKVFAKKILTLTQDIIDFKIAVMRDDEHAWAYAEEHYPTLVEFANWRPKLTVLKDYIPPSRTLDGWKPGAEKED